MEDHRPYVDADLKLNQLAAALGIKPHLLSQLLNDELKQNFPEFVNIYRIKHAKQLMSGEDHSKKLITIAYDSGFNNKVSFNNAFKKIEGTSPSAYRKTLKNGHSPHQV